MTALDLGGSEEAVGPKGAASYKIVVDGLKLPRWNEVIRWHYRQRKEEVDKTRRSVEIAMAGLGNVEPLASATVRIRAYGDYSRYDGEAVCYKFVLDSIVARTISAYGNNVGRRAGLIVDDSRKCIGKPDCDDVPADAYRVEITVTQGARQ